MSTTMGSATSFKLGGTPNGEGRIQKRQKILLGKNFNSFTVARYDGLKEVVRLQHVDILLR